jgi:hypothetical protein
MRRLNLFDYIPLIAAFAIFAFLYYSIIGTDSRVNEIKAKAPVEMQARNWKVLRYEGFQYGSYSTHGGKVWYHVANVDNPNIQYRVFVTLWNGELHYHYGQPETLKRIEIDK